MRRMRATDSGSSAAREVAARIPPPFASSAAEELITGIHARPAAISQPAKPASAMVHIAALLKRSFAGAAALAVAAYGLFTGPRNLEQYPAPSNSPYKLPWPAGLTWLCIQSNRGIVSHRESEEFAFDFKMPEGSPVCAARGGVVIGVDDTHQGNGVNAPNNAIVIDHGDGTRGVYLHLQKGGSLVSKGAQVVQGQKIGLSGNVGRSMLPHLHFHVSPAAKGGTMPVSFFDVQEDAGVPRMFHRYTSQNR
jgi:murein DD-endopeptidase MepM/ murein hydrolase activator NlpD